MLPRQGLSVAIGTLGRACAAGLAAALFGVGLGTYHYAHLAGSHELDWSWLALALAGFAVFAGLLGGLGLGGATAWAVRSAGGPQRVSALRMVAAGIAGGLVGTTLPGIVGIAGFGSLNAPYAGTGNIVFCLLVSSTAFVSLWAPVLWCAGGHRPIAWVEHLGLSALAASLAIASLGILGATLCTSMGLVPTFEWLVEVAQQIGLVPLAIAAATIIASVIGAAMGFACWLYLSAALVIERRFR